MCPLDEFELLLFSLSGVDGKTCPLCPFCYNYPPFENVVKVRVCYCLPSNLSSNLVPPFPVPFSQAARLFRVSGLLL